MRISKAEKLHCLTFLIERIPFVVDEYVMLLIKDVQIHLRPPKGITSEVITQIL